MRGMRFCSNRLLDSTRHCRCRRLSASLQRPLIIILCMCERGMCESMCFIASAMSFTRLEDREGESRANSAPPGFRLVFMPFPYLWWLHRWLICLTATGVYLWTTYNMEYLNTGSYQLLKRSVQSNHIFGLWFPFQRARTRSSQAHICC